MIQPLVDNEDEEGLKKISQQLIQNAFYNSIRFGAHNDTGIHGACPMEMLHALHLGVFKYVRDCFFAQLGSEKGKSTRMTDFDAYASEYGRYFQRQSYRGLPRTTFAKGIRVAKLTAKEYPGVLLCMAAVLRSTAGRKCIKGKDGFSDKDGNAINDWVLLIETLLQWEQWLKSANMERAHVEAARGKHRYIIYLLKNVGRRTKGMGFKVVKVHGIVHMADDILNFGVPLEVDTGSNESGHKGTKVAARLTQKCEATFVPQTATRLEEFRLLTLAELEMMGKCLWDYGKTIQETTPIGGDSDSVSSDSAQLGPEMVETALGGSKILIKRNDESGTFEAHSLGRNSHKRNTILEQDFIDFVGELQKSVAFWYHSLIIRTELKRNNTIFRASTNFNGKVWRDWAIIDWAVEGKLPAKIWGFLDLGDVAIDAGITYGSCNIEPGMYAIIESATPVNVPDDGQVRSDLFSPYEIEVGGFTNDRVSHLKFYLVSVDAIYGEVAMIPDFGGPVNAYFRVKECPTWAKDFTVWLESEGDDEIIEDDSGPEDGEE